MAGTYAFVEAISRVKKCCLTSKLASWNKVSIVCTLHNLARSNRTSGFSFMNTMNSDILLFSNTFLQ